MTLENQFFTLEEFAFEDAPVESRQIGVIYNRHSHQNRGLDLAAVNIPNIIVAQPADKDDLPRVLAEFAAGGIELLVILGGDGTVRDVLTCGLSVWGDDWPALAVLPRGKTNALNVDLGAPNAWSPGHAIAAFHAGKLASRRALVVGGMEGELAGENLHGFILGAGALTTGIRVGQDAHSLGMFNSLAVAGTALWGVLQAIFGSDRNVWRRGVGMRLHIGQRGEELAHSGFGDPARRAFLFSSTLERFPAGMKPFGSYREGLKLVVIDKTRRRLLALLPAMVWGWVPDWVQRMGLHFAQCESYSLQVDEEFILDGEAFPPGTYSVAQGPELRFVVP